MSAAPTLRDEARQLLREGRAAEAERAFANVLCSSPNDVEALNVLGLAALREGNLSRSLELLGRAVRLRPELHVARLYLGAALERAKEQKAAVLQYARAMNGAQSQGQWLNAETTPAALRPLVERAVIAVRTGRRAVLDDVLASLATRFGRDALTRVERCMRVYLREETAVSPDARQQPSFLYFPGLEASPYLDRSLFPWIEAFEAGTAAIRTELQRLLPSSAGRERVFDNEVLERQHLRGLDVAPSWTGYYFYRHGQRREDNCAACPATAEALERLPLVHVRDHGPEVLFSVFTPGTHLLPHRGVTNTRVVGHLPLVVPENCALSVGGEVHAWKPGRVVVFDDTYEHEAWNRSAQTRVVMIFDVWHPDLTEPERTAITELIVAIGDFRKAAEGA